MPPEVDLELNRIRERVRVLELELKQRHEMEKALRDLASEQRLAAQENLLASEARFHHLIDAVTDYAIFMLDPNGHVATWNPGAKSTKGYAADEIIGQHFSIFYTPEEREAGRPERILDILRREGRFEDESWRVRKDGSRFWANVVITALRGSNGEITGFAKVTRDLTSRREAEERERALAREQLARTASEEERARLLTLLKQLPASVNLLRGPDLVLEFVHPNTTKALGGRELAGKPLLVAIPEFRDQPYHARLQRVYETGEAFQQRGALVWLVVDGRKVETYWDSVYLPMRDASGAIEGVMTFDLDVTDSVLARRALEQTSRAKDEFLATMSHELRTPLNAIMGWAGLLKGDSSDPALRQRGLDVIERNAKTQSRLVSDLLDVSRIISGKLNLTVKKLQVGAVIHAAVDVVRHAAEAKNVRLVVDVDPDVGAITGDPDRLQQVVWNLLSNAVRFTPANGRVALTARRPGSEVVVQVQDTGAGILPQHLPLIFDRFKQVDSSITRAHGGLGLGLSIVRHLVEAHGGTVSAASEGLGMGAVFTVVLPIHAVSVPSAFPGESDSKSDAADRESPLQHDLDGVSVLVVDDERDSLELVRLVLEGSGARVTTVTSAQDALDARGPFDVIISDIGMPEVDGYTFMRRLRSRETDSRVPAIALTAYARVEDADRALRAGFQQHLAKPVDAHKLLELVDTWAHSGSRQIA